jgi:hypothetical protein
MKTRNKFFNDGKPHARKRFLLRLLDITMLGNYFLFGGLIISIMLEKILKYFYDSNKLTNEPTYLLVLAIIFSTATLMISAYILRHLIYKIPCPFDTMWGYNHYKTRELRGGIIIAFSFIMFLKTYKEILRHLVVSRFNLN